MGDIESAIRHLDEAIRILTLEAYRGIDPEHMVPCNDMCSITENLNRVDCAIGPRGKSMFATLAQDALAAFTEIKLARAALSPPSPTEEGE